MTRVAAAVRRHGPAGLPGALARRAAATARERAERREELAFDRDRGIDTVGVIREGATPYQPVHPAAFAEFLTHVETDPAGATFVDVGSGRGRALFLAVEHGFRAAVGIEIEVAHHRVALENLRRYRGTRGEAIQLLRGDACELVLPAGPLVVFVYNPFARDVMVAFVARVARRLRDDGAWVIYEAPLDRDLFDAEPCFELVAERMERDGASPRRPRFAIYRVRRTA